MKSSIKIPINQFQLAVLLNEEQKQIYKFMLDEGVLCSQCGDIAAKGIEVKEIYLTKLNDIMVCGTCNVCNVKVARIMEFGEDKAFYEKASDFRKTIKNQF